MEDSIKKVNTNGVGRDNLGTSETKLEEKQNRICGRKKFKNQAVVNNFRCQRSFEKKQYQQPQGLSI